MFTVVEQCLTSPPKQYTLVGRQFYSSKTQQCYNRKPKNAAQNTAKTINRDTENPLVYNNIMALG